MGGGGDGGWVGGGDGAEGAGGGVGGVWGGRHCGLLRGSERLWVKGGGRIVGWGVVSVFQVPDDGLRLKLRSWDRSDGEVIGH